MARRKGAEQSSIQSSEGWFINHPRYADHFEVSRIGLEDDGHGRSSDRRYVLTDSQIRKALRSGT